MTAATQRHLNGPLAVLRDGTTVLAKPDGYPVTYANRTQAERRAAILQAEGMETAVLHRGRPFYVRVIEAGETE